MLHKLGSIIGQSFCLEYALARSDLREPCYSCIGHSAPVVVSVEIGTSVHV